MKRRLGLLVGAVIVAASVVPVFTGGANLDRMALALALAGLGAGTALAAAAGRPLLATAAFGGIGAYVSALSALHQVPVPVAVLCGCSAGAAAGALVGVLGARLDGPAFLLLSMLVAVAAGALVQATPEITGAESGLGPIPALSLPIGDSRSAVLTPVGDFQLMLFVAASLTAIAMALMRSGPGPRWRAIGSDRGRARDSGLHPLGAEVAVLALCGAFAGLSGALAAHLAQAATPGAFALDVGALPLLAALAANRDPLGAAALAVATGVFQLVLLPSLGWQGPLSAQSLSLVALALVALLALLFRRNRRIRGGPEIQPVDGDEAWPVAGLRLTGVPLAVEPILLRSQKGATLVDAPAFSVRPGSIHAVVGPNGAGKTTLLRAIQSAARVGTSTLVRTAGPARITLLPQAGGGFGACTVAETLRLAARPGRTRQEAGEISAAWIRRLGLDGAADRLCAELSGGQRRLVDLARVLIRAPNVLLCDEPLAGLDDSQRVAAVGCLGAAAGSGLTILIAEHDHEAVASLATAVTELQRGPSPAPSRASYASSP